MQPDLIFYSSRSGNTARFVARLGGTSYRIPIAQEDPMPSAERPYVLVCPTYSDSLGEGAVPKQVIRFLNDPQRRAKLLGVIAAGNRNFGATFALGGKIIAEKCKVPVLYRFELAGTDKDIELVMQGLTRLGLEKLGANTDA